MGWWRKKKKKKPLNEIESKIGARLLEDLIECCDGKSNPIKFFSADEIRKATDNFSESNRVSTLISLEYDWYSGKTENHHKILIKKDCDWSKVVEVYFCRDVAVSSMVSGHKNFRKLIGCCLEYKDPVMVYDGVKKHYQLVIKEQPWKRRMKIAEDIATALAYLHTAFPRPFVYRSMSLDHIFFDEDGVTELSSFSNCVSIRKGETFVEVDRIVGTVDYLDEKYITTSVVSEETDVFAIGIVMQKLLMGYHRCFHWHNVKEEEDDAKEEGDGEGDDDDDGDDTTDSATISKKNDKGKQFFQSRLLKFMEEGRMDEITDPEMVEKMGEISEQELCRMKAFGLLSLRCTGVRGKVPTMVEVAKELKKIQRSLRNDTLNSSPSGETPFDSAQHSSSSVVLSNNSLNTKALLA